MAKKITFITYAAFDEIIVTTPKREEQTIKEYFFDVDRDIEDYDRTEHYESAVSIEPKLVVKWG